ncbi:MAG: GNAT family N-acetyltransferase [Anaerolineales bacterium]|nr:GNAT family N-acetyltransferase [Anaerolineales bacterium]
MRFDDLFHGTLVRLAAMRPEDREHFARWSNDVEYMRLLDDEPMRPRNPDYFQLPRVEDEQNSAFFSIRTIEEDRLIGFCSLFLIEWKNRSCFMGVGIGERGYWGQGFGSEAVDLLVGYAFRELNLNRVGLYVFDHNVRARRAYEKVGFTQEATLRESAFRDGERYDIHIMGILYREWVTKRRTEG